MDVLSPTLRTMILPDGPGLSAEGTDIERIPELPDAMAAKIGGGDAGVIHARSGDSIHCNRGAQSSRPY
jgi:hypothetical protein